MTDDKTVIVARAAFGGIMTVFSLASLVGLTNVSEKIMEHPMPSGLWWGLVTLFSTMLVVGLVLAVIGLRELVPPTSLVYRLVHPTRFWDRLAHRRRRS